MIVLVVCMLVVAGCVYAPHLWRSRGGIVLSGAGSGDGGGGGVGGVVASMIFVVVDVMLVVLVIVIKAAVAVKVLVQYSTQNSRVTLSSTSVIHKGSTPFLHKKGGMF
jgi:hypothetical protein